MADVKALTKSWIQYLKNNRIAELQSDPETGKINYRKKVTTGDVADFLEKNTDYGEEAISNAIHMVLTKKATGNGPAKLQNNPTPKEPGRDLSTWHHYGMSPGTPVEREPKLQNNPRNNDDAEDIDFRDVDPDEPRQLGAPPRQLSGPKRKPRFKGYKPKLEEAFTDEEGYTLSEDEVELIFNMLSKSQGQSAAPAEQPSEQPQGKKEEQFNRIKEMIRYKLSSSQRKALWRALNEN